MLSMHFTAQRRWMSCECFVNAMGWMFALLRRMLILAHFSHFSVVITLTIYFSWGLKKKKHPRILYQKIKLSLNTKESVSKSIDGLRCWCLCGKLLYNTFSWQNRTSYCKNRILIKIFIKVSWFSKKTLHKSFDTEDWSNDAVNSTLP